MSRHTRGGVARRLEATASQASSRVGEQYQATRIPAVAVRSRREPGAAAAAAERPEGDARVGQCMWSPAGATGLSAGEIAKFVAAVHALPCPGAPRRAGGSPRLRAAKLEPEPEPRSVAPVAAAAAPAAAGLSVDTAPVSSEQDEAVAVAEAIARALPPQAVPLAHEEALSALHAAGYKPKDALAGLGGDSPVEAAGAAAFDFSGPKRCAEPAASFVEAWRHADQQLDSCWKCFGRYFLCALLLPLTISRATCCWFRTLGQWGGGEHLTFHNAIQKYAPSHQPHTPKAAPPSIIPLALRSSSAVRDVPLGITAGRT